MVLKRVNVKTGDRFCSPKFGNSCFDCNLTKHFPVKILVAPLYVKIFDITVHGSLFAEIILDAPWLMSARTSGISYYVGFEKSPKQIVCNLSILYKWGETLGRRLCRLS